MEWEIKLKRWGVQDQSKQSLWEPLKKITWSDDYFPKITLVGGC